MIGASPCVALAFILGGGFPKQLCFWKWAAVLEMSNFGLLSTPVAYGQFNLPKNVTGAVFSSIPLFAIGLAAPS